MRFAIIIFLNVLIFNIGIFSQVLNIPKQDTSKKINAISEFQRDIDYILKSKDINDCFAGISIVSIQDGQVLYKRNDIKNFVPASNQKLFTTATALRYLGADYRFLTRMYLDGETSPQGTFFGNIIIRGFGDPSHSPSFKDNPSAVFEYYKDILDSLGIKEIEGNIIGDDNFFDDNYYAEGWQINDLIFPFSAQINSLSYNDNTVNLTIQSGESIDDYCRITSEQNNLYFELNNYCLTSSPNSEPNIVAFRQEGTNIITINGNFPFDPTLTKSYKLSVTIDNPTLWFLSNFKEYLNANAISVNGALLDVDDLNQLPDYTIIKDSYTFHSIKLSDIIGVINKNSNNLAAEMLLKTIAREISGYGSTMNGIIQIDKFAKRLGAESEKNNFVDGSGLSRLNLCSPKSITNLLISMYKSEYGALFQNSLAQPGENGTLKKRLTKTLAQGKLHAKTGSLNNISTFSGYTYSRDNEPIAFSIMFISCSTNLNTIQNIQDLIALRITAFTKNP